MLKLIRHAALACALQLSSSACGDGRDGANGSGTSVELDGEHYDPYGFDAVAVRTETGLALRYLALVDVEPGTVDDEVSIRVDIDLKLALFDDLPREQTVLLEGEAQVDLQDFDSAPYYDLELPTATTFESFGDDPALERAALVVVHMISMEPAGPFSERLYGVIHFDELSEGRARGQLTLGAVGLTRDDYRLYDSNPLFRSGVRVEAPFDLEVQP